MTQTVKKRGRAQVRVFGQAFDAQGNLTGVPIECRFAFPYVFEKRTKSAAGELLDTPRNDIVVLVPKRGVGGDCPNWQKLSAILMEAAVDLWGTWPAGYNPKIQDGDIPHRPKPRPGTTPKTEEQIREANKWREGHWVIEAATPPNSLPKVSIMDTDGKPIEIPAQVIAGVEQFKSGDYGYIALNAYTFESKGNWGINFGLEQVMFSRSGDRIGGGSGPKSAAQRFGGIAPTAAAPTMPTPQPPQPQYAPAPQPPQPAYAAPPVAPAMPQPAQPQYAAPAAPVGPPAAVMPGQMPLPPLPGR